MKNSLVGLLRDCIAALSLAPAAMAQNYPTRQITLIVPFAPGGPADFLGRLIGQKMSEDLGQQIVIDNRAGRQYHHRRAGGRQGRARWLHAADGDRRHAGDEPVPLQQARLRPVQGFRAGLADRARAVRDGRQHQHSGELDQGTGRAGKGQARHLPDRHQYADFAGQRRVSSTRWPAPISAWCPIAAVRRRSPESWRATSRSAWRASTCRCRSGAPTRSRSWAW